MVRHVIKEGKRYKLQKDGRLSAHARGYDRRWNKRRKQWLDQHPLCARCEQLGTVKAASVVDHVIPHRGDRALFEDDDNLQSLCKHCHDSWKKGIENGNASYDVDGWPIDDEAIQIGTSATKDRRAGRDDRKRDGSAKRKRDALRRSKGKGKRC